MPYFEEYASSFGKFYTKFGCVIPPSQMFIHEDSKKLHVLSPLNVMLTNFQVIVFSQFLPGGVKKYIVCLFNIWCKLV